MFTDFENYIRLSLARNYLIHIPVLMMLIVLEQMSQINNENYLKPG